MAKLVPKIYPNDVNENNPIGVSYPFTVGNVKQNYITTDQIHDNLRNLCLTMKGERPMQPTFGSDLYHLLFEPINDDILSQAARKAIREAVNQWMPYIEIVNVNTTSRRDEHIVIITVQYKVDGWPADNALNMEVRV
tara:strand:- start:13 stop:423 length:411 start_codon:yes stop_codon:yes gene_type:complete